jgi:uncharacterized protein (DUF3084 family)
MTNGSDRLDRIEHILEEVAKRQNEMAARPQYHDQAFDRHDAAMKQHDAAIKLHDAKMKDIRDAIAALVHVAGVQNQRLNQLEGGEPA